MPVLKKPKKDDKELRLSILADIEKSTVVRLNQYADISAKLAEPLTKSGILGVVTDFQKSTQVLTDLATSPAFTRATEALVTTKHISDSLITLTAPAMKSMQALSSVVVKPMEHLIDTVSILNRNHQFDLSIKAITETADIFSSKPLMARTFEVEPITYRPPQTQITAIVAVLKERFDNFADEITEKVDQKFQERFDILIEQGIIPAGIKKANCHCPKCDRLLFKVMDMSHFMIGTLKCECRETLQIPRDLKIVPDN